MHDTGDWGHFCHMDQVPEVAVGDQVVTGTFLGQIQEDAGLAVRPPALKVRRTKPETWNFWPYNWSQEQVGNVYY